MQGHHRDSHPEGFTGGGGAVVGEGVQSDVHIVISGQMLSHAHGFANQKQPFPADAFGGESFKVVPAHAGVVQGGILQHEFRPSDLFENQRPGLNHHVSGLGWIVEAAEGYIALFEHGGCGDRRAIIRGPVAVEAVWQAIETFPCKLIRISWRIGVGIAEPGYLHRGRFYCKNLQAVAVGMTGQVHQYVDFVGGDLSGQGRIVHGGNIPPTIHQSAKLPGYGIDFDGVRIADETHPFPVVGGK